MRLLRGGDVIVGYWYKGPAAQDANHVVHLCIGSYGGVPGEFLVLCTNNWMRFDARLPGYVAVDTMITCVVCAMFVVHDGEVSSWVPR